MLIQNYDGTEEIDADYIISFRKDEIDLPSGTVYRVSARIVNRERSVVLLEGVTEKSANMLMKRIRDHKNKKDID